MKNQTKKIKISRNFLCVKMVWEDMKSLPMMHIIGKKVWNFRYTKHKLYIHRHVNCQNAQHHHYLIAQFLIFMQEPVFWSFIDKANQKMEWTKGD